MKKLYYIIISLGLIITSCETKKSTSTKLYSDDYERKEDRIEKLKKEIKDFSEFKDAEFELFNVNGFHNDRILVPGASSCDYKFVIRVDTADVFKWTTEMTEVELRAYDDSWTKEIIKHRMQNWTLDSKPKYFVRKGADVTMLVFKKEGIIFKRVTRL